MMIMIIPYIGLAVVIDCNLRPEDRESDRLHGQYHRQWDRRCLWVQRYTFFSPRFSSALDPLTLLMITPTANHNHSVTPPNSWPFIGYLYYPILLGSAAKLTSLLEDAVPFTLHGVLASNPVDMLHFSHPKVCTEVRTRWFQNSVHFVSTSQYSVLWG